MTSPEPEAVTTEADDDNSVLHDLLPIREKEESNLSENSEHSFNSNKELHLAEDAAVAEGSVESGTEFSHQRRLQRGSEVAAAASVASGNRRSVAANPKTFHKRSDFGDFWPDGGWGWAICCAAFTANSLSHGMFIAFGSLDLEIREYSTGEKSSTGAVWIGSVGFAVSMLQFPLVTSLCRRKSIRLVSIVGNLITMLGCLFLSFSRETHELMISYSLVLCTGLGICRCTASLIVGKYFHCHRDAAEMLSACGSGVGACLVAVFVKYTTRSLGWIRCFQLLTGIQCIGVFASMFYRPVELYHPKRIVIEHLKTFCKTRKSKRDFENPPVYCNFAPLRMRTTQLILLISAVMSIGLHVPVLIMIHTAQNDGIPADTCVLLLVMLGVAFSVGSFICGIVVVKSSLHCVISKQYLCQLSLAGCGVTTILSVLAENAKGYGTFVCCFGVFYGGFHYAIKVYIQEVFITKMADEVWAYAVGVQVLPTLVCAPVAINFNSLCSKTGFAAAGAFMLAASLFFYGMPSAAKHSSTISAVRKAHAQVNEVKNSDIYYFGMKVSDFSGYYLDNETAGASCRESADVIELDSNPKQSSESSLSWRQLRRQTPRSPSDRVADFLRQTKYNRGSLLANRTRSQSVRLDDVTAAEEGENKRTLYAEAKSAQNGGAGVNCTAMATRPRQNIVTEENNLNPYMRCQLTSSV